MKRISKLEYLKLSKADKVKVKSTKHGYYVEEK